MAEEIPHFGPAILPEAIQDAADLVLDTHGLMLRDLMSSPDLKALREKIIELTPAAEEVLEKDHVTGNMAKRAFADAAVRRWIKSHRTEKLPE